MNNKIIRRTGLKRLLKGLQKENRRIVFTNGCFDIIHAGHIRYLKEAKRCGDVLIVGLNSDLSVKKIKGSLRPIVPQDERAEVLSALEPVDYIVVFNEPTPYNLIKTIQPDVLVKGADWTEDRIIGAEIVKAKGGKVFRIKLARGKSTTNIIKKILDTHQWN